MRTREEGTPNRGSVALDALCKDEEAKGYGAQSRLAKELEADEGQFSRWRRGVRTPGVAMRMKLQERHGIPAMSWDEPIAKSEPPPAEEPAPDSASKPTGAPASGTGTDGGGE